MTDTKQLQQQVEALRGHKWVGRQVGGSPASEASYEWVRFCEICGSEDTCEDPLPPCISIGLSEQASLEREQWKSKAQALLPSPVTKAENKEVKNG